MAASAHGMAATGSELPVLLFHPTGPLLFQLGMGARTASLRGDTAAARVDDDETAGEVAPAAAVGMAAHEDASAVAAGVAAHEDAPAVAAADAAGTPAPDASPAPALHWQYQNHHWVEGRCCPGLWDRGRWRDGRRVLGGRFAAASSRRVERCSRLLLTRLVAALCQRRRAGGHRVRGTVLQACRGWQRVVGALENTPPRRVSNAQGCATAIGGTVAHRHTCCPGLPAPGLAGRVLQSFLDAGAGEVRPIG